jgi:hypothetical protein
MEACRQRGARPLLRRLLVVREIARGVDQREVRKGLREITDQPPAARIVFLAQKADVVAQREEDN